MRAGRLRHRVTVQRVTETQDATGAPVQVWADLFETFAAVEPLRGREFFSARALQETVDTRIVLRYRAGIIPKDRVIWGTRTFDIKDVINPDERNRELQLMVTELL